MILLRQRREYSCELLGVAGAVVGRNAYSNQQQAGSGGLYQLCHLAKVGARDVQRQSAQSVIGAKFKDHDTWLVQLQGPGQPFEPAFRRLTAYAGVDDLVPVPLCLQS